METKEVRLYQAAFFCFWLIGRLHRVIRKGTILFIIYSN